MSLCEIRSIGVFHTCVKMFYMKCDYGLIFTVCLPKVSNFQWW